METMSHLRRSILCSTISIIECEITHGVIAVYSFIYVPLDGLHSISNYTGVEDDWVEGYSVCASTKLMQLDTHNQAGIAHSGDIVSLLKLLDSRIGILQHNAAFALYGLVDSKDNVADMIRVGGVQKLLDGEFVDQEAPAGARRG
ncbi:hypothetical protein L2E82_16807 [Cichorium intybus]|uniref:Uncharacterized protein n=1 Tax=Cichorium intybus TaxID=13427 RepID=A0ACB9F7T9_CICIN|nr:hypothetical protein L2E82_16807 [Cichorium intybus]